MPIAVARRPTAARHGVNMFVIRQATQDDLSTLLKLARMVHFINLPPDRDIIAAKIARSRRSFGGQVESEREREFMFVLEDVTSGNVIGTSAILSCISWPGHPHTFLKVRRRDHFSDDLQTGTKHITLELGTDESGPSEMGGLILAPGYRGHREHLGTLLSLIRFHYIGLHRDSFSERIIAELMGALTPDSRNLLWEYLGRRFINLQYVEADRFCQHSKEFITALFPRVEIYASLLPPEARNLIGRVGEETRPARTMLEAQGFVYEDRVDPFDGGPYISANRDEIPLVKTTFEGILGDPVEGIEAMAFVSAHGERGFRAIKCAAAIDGDRVSISAEAAGVLDAVPGDAVGVTPIPSREERARVAAAQSQRKSKRSTKIDDDVVAPPKRATRRSSSGTTKARTTSRKSTKS